MDLEDQLNEEIYDQARRHKLKIVKERRRQMGLPVQEFDDLSEEEEKLDVDQLGDQLGLPEIVRPDEARRDELLGEDVNDGSNLYSLADNVEDLIETHMFDTRSTLLNKIKALSGEPD